jgi:hypothetical protein
MTPAIVRRFIGSLELLGLLTICSLAPSLAAQTVPQASWARLAAYTDIVWPDSTPGRPSVRLGDAWFELVSVDGVPVPEIIAAARQSFGAGWQKRFDEDLVEVMGGMGRTVGPTVTLGLRSPGAGEVVTRTAPMNAQNRAAMMRAKIARAGGPAAYVGAAVTAARARPTQMTGADVAQDLAALQREMESRWAYLRANSVDYGTAIARLRERGANGMGHTQVGLEVRRLVSMFIDGHASVGGFTYPAGSLPFLVEATGGRYVAVRRDRTGFVDPDVPFIAAIDGRPISDWLAAVAPYVSKSSPQWIERNSLAHLQRLGFLRMLLGLPDGGPVRLELTSRDGSRTREVELSDSTSRSAARPNRASGIRDGNIISATCDSRSWTPGPPPRSIAG